MIRTIPQHEQPQTSDIEKQEPVRYILVSIYPNKKVQEHLERIERSTSSTEAIHTESNDDGLRTKKNIKQKLLKYAHRRHCI